MMGRSLSLARRWAWSRCPAHRWRLLTLSLSAFLGTAALVLGLGLVGSAQRIDQRQEARRPMVTEAVGSRQPGELRMVLRGLVWEGVQTPVVWLDGDERSPVPPGLARLPEAGSVVVSPAVSAAGFTDETMGLRVDDAGAGTSGTIGEGGLAAESEWLIYARPASGRDLGAGGSIFSVRGFGAAPSPAWPLAIETTEPGPPQRVAALVAGALVALPVLILLSVSGSALSGLLVARFDSLARQGITRGSLLLIAAAESALITLPCALLGGTVAWVFLRSARAMPWSGHQVLQGDLSVPLSVTLACVLVVVLAGAVGATAAVGRSPRAATGQTALVLSDLATGGLAVAALVMLASRQLQSHEGLLGGLVLAAGTIALAVPSVVRRVGTRERLVTTPHAWLAARRVAHDPIGLTRPAGVLASLMLAVLAFTGIQGQLARPVTDGAEAAPRAAAVSIGWRDPVPTDADFLREVAQDAGATLQVDPESDGTRYVEVRGDADAVRAVVEAAQSSLPAANVFDPAAPLDRRHDASWYLPWGLLAGLVLGGAAITAFGSRALALLREDDDLVRAGLSPADVRRVQGTVLTCTAAAALVLGGGVGVLFLWCADAVELTMTSLGAVVTETVLVTSMTGAAIWVIRRWAGTGGAGRGASSRT